MLKAPPMPFGDVGAWPWAIMANWRTPYKSSLKLLHEWILMGKRLYCSQQYQGLSLASASIMILIAFNIIWLSCQIESDQRWVLRESCLKRPVKKLWFAAKMDLTKQSFAWPKNLLCLLERMTPMTPAWAVTGCQHGSTAAGVQSNRCGSCRIGTRPLSVTIQVRRCWSKMSQNHKWQRILVVNLKKNQCKIMQKPGRKLNSVHMAADQNLCPQCASWTWTEWYYILYIVLYRWY